MQQIIALGGGGFSMTPDNLALDRYVLESCQKARPKVCFLGQASAESPDYALRFYRAFLRLGADPSDLTLFQNTPQDVRALLLRQDAIYVGGGNTLNMVALWRAWGVDLILREALQCGVVLAGISAGAICWFQEGLTDSRPGNLTRVEALGLLPGSFSPHYDGEPGRRPRFHELLQAQGIAPGLAADDDVALHFVDGRLQRVVAARDGAAAYRLSLRQGKVREERLTADVLAPQA